VRRTNNVRNALEPTRANRLIVGKLALTAESSPAHCAGASRRPLIGHAVPRHGSLQWRRSCGKAKSSRYDVSAQKRKQKPKLSGVDSDRGIQIAMLPSSFAIFIAAQPHGLGARPPVSSTKCSEGRSASRTARIAMPSSNSCYRSVLPSAHDR
jgi:hypothetical protein